MSETREWLDVELTPGLTDNECVSICDRIQSVKGVMLAGYDASYVHDHKFNAPKKADLHKLIIVFRENSDNSASKEEISSIPGVVKVAPLPFRPRPPDWD